MFPSIEMPIDTTFLQDLIGAITERGRGLVGLAAKPERKTHGDLVALSEQLMTGRGEASGVALASEILEGYAEASAAERLAYLEALAASFGPDVGKLEAAARAFLDDKSAASVTRLSAVAEPRRQELIRRLNLAPGGTSALVAMRVELLRHLKDRPALAALDSDFQHLFSSWFNRGFLVLRHIDWRTPANILAKVIQYEAVHTIQSWDDLRARLEPADRRCYAFFHPQLVDEPLIFVEVALTRDMPDAIAPLLDLTRGTADPRQATTAVFYSISNCQAGLRGVSFGNFLIKQVVEELKREMPNLKTFVTLSPVPGFAEWLRAQLAAGTDGLLDPGLAALLADIAALGPKGIAGRDARVRDKVREALQGAAAAYFLRAKGATGKPVDQVARFHLGNGARLERINVDGDLSTKGRAQAAGLMVNYLYDLGSIEANHEAYANRNEVVASAPVKKLLKPEGKTRLALPKPTAAPRG